MYIQDSAESSDGCKVIVLVLHQKTFESNKEETLLARPMRKDAQQVLWWTEDQLYLWNKRTCAESSLAFGARTF